MSERMPWFRCVPAALLGALAGMRPDEGYVYVVLLLRIYETGGPVMESDRTMSRRTGLPERKVASALQFLIETAKVVRLDDGRLDSLSTHDEIRWQLDRRHDQSKAGKASKSKKNVSFLKKDASGDGGKTEQNQQNKATSVEQASNHIDIEEEIEEGRTHMVGKPTECAADDGFDLVWKALPKRSGNNSRKNAESRYRSALKAGTQPSAILAGANAYAEHCAARQIIGTEYVKTAEAWINGRMWESDYSTAGRNRGPPRRSFSDIVREGIQEIAGQDHGNGNCEADDGRPTLDLVVSGEGADRFDLQPPGGSRRAPGDR